MYFIAPGRYNPGNRKSNESKAAFIGIMYCLSLTRLDYNKPLLARRFYETK
jgi:hypothetical protein